MANTKRPKLDKPMKKDIARYYAQMMYADDRKLQEEEVGDYQKKLIQESLENIKERVFHICPYCHERQEFKGEGHREQTINGKFYWIQNCPKCNQEVWMHLFTKRFVENGQVDYLVDSRWMCKEDALRLRSEPVEQTKPKLGFGIAKP